MSSDRLNTAFKKMLNFQVINKQRKDCCLAKLSCDFSTVNFIGIAYILCPRITNRNIFFLFPFSFISLRERFRPIKLTKIDNKTNEF